MNHLPKFFSTAAAVATAITLLTLSAPSCKKDSVTPTDHLASLYVPEHLLHLNQEVIIFDSTALRDSIDFVDPPPTRLYKWTITPADDTAVFSGPYTRGLATIIFNKPGIYAVSAAIYDSMGQRLIGHTDIYPVTVTADTLYHSLPILANDQLILKVTDIDDGNANSSYAVGIQFMPQTTDRYDDYSFLSTLVYTSAANNSFTFSDSIYLSTFPYVYGNDTLGPVLGDILTLSGFTPGVTEPLTITWLGQTYTGTITETAPYQFTYNWPNNIPVKLIE